MKERAKTTSGNKAKAKTIVLVVCLSFWIISIVFNFYITSAEEAKKKPDLGAKSFIKALREYRQRRGIWPQDLKGLNEAKIWSVTGTVIGKDGHSIEAGNYYYRYYLLDGDAVSLWAVPLGEYSYLGATHYLLIGRTKMRHWMGPPLSSKEQVKWITPHPIPEQLERLGLKEQNTEIKVSRW
jgi:hypothetical protein